MSDVVISSGHGKYVRGASGYIDEVDEARIVVERVAQFLRGYGMKVETFHDNTSESQDENLATIVDFHNSHERGLDISVHFNAYETTQEPMGTECLYVTQEDLAGDMAAEISRVGELYNRGAKLREDLYFLNNTDQPAILIEVCFVDSRADVDAYSDNLADICKGIALVARDFLG